MSIDASGERELLIKAVRVNTLSKLTYDDTRQFLALIGDVFPGAKSSDILGVSDKTNPLIALAPLLAVPGEKIRQTTHRDDNPICWSG